MEEDSGNGAMFRQDLQGGSSSTHPIPVGMPLNIKDKQPAGLKEEHQLLPLSSLPNPLNQQLQQQSQDQPIMARDRILFPEQNQQEVPALAAHEQPKQAEASITLSTGIGEGEGLIQSIPRDPAQKVITNLTVDPTNTAESPSKKTDVISTKPNHSKPTTEQSIKSGDPAITMAPIRKKVTKRPRAKPGFGLKTSRTTIVDTGQKRRSCICTNSKLCNELMTKWAKVSPPDYHFVQLPREHIPTASSDHPIAVLEPQKAMPGKTSGTVMDGPGESSNGSNNNNNTNMSDTDIYKNGFRYATLRNMKAKNPIPKDERVALCHYHPEVRPYLFWPKNTPSAQKYAIPMSLAVQLGYDTVANKCQGFNTEKYCYAIPAYSFEDAKKEIESVEEAFNERVRQIKTNPTQFVRDLRQCEEELKEVHKLRRRNAELLRRLDDRRRSIKRLKSVLKVQRHATKEAQQQQLVAQAVSANAQVVANSNAVQQQYQHHAYQTTTAFHQQQLVDSPQQQQQATGISQPLGQQNHTQFFQPPPPTQEQQAIGIVVGGLTQNNDHQQHEQQHHWTYTQYNPNTLGVAPGSENDQQHTQQQVQLAVMHAYDSAQHHQQHDQQHQQQAVPSPMDDHNNSGAGFSYAQQLEAAMAAAVAAGFKDDQEDVEHHQHHGDLVGDVVDLDELEHHDGFGGDNGDDDDLEDDDWSDAEQYRQAAGGGISQNHQRPRKWPRRTVILPPVSSEVDEIPKKSKRKSKATNSNNKKKAKSTKGTTTKTKKKDDVSGVIVHRNNLSPKREGKNNIGE